MYVNRMQPKFLYATIAIAART